MNIKNWIDAFILERRNRNFSTEVTDYYQRELEDFEAFASSHNVNAVSEVTADLIRAYILYLESKGHTVGGLRTKFQAIPTFLKWYSTQSESEDWQNPIKKIKLPKETSTSIKRAIIADINAMIATCKNDFHGTRDKALMLCLLDTAAGVEEILKMNLVDVDLNEGSVVIRQGKTGESKNVVIERETIQALRDYLRFRPDESPPALWLTSSGNRLTDQTLPVILFQRGKMAGIQPPSIKDFKRASKRNREDQ